MRETKAIIFDLDGVLVDSMPAHVRAWKEAFDKVATIRVSDRDIYLLEGMRGIELVSKILQERNKSVDDQLAARVNEEKNRIFKSTRSSGPFAGVAQLLDQIRCNTAVVSGSAKEDVYDMLRDSFAHAKFSAVITADDIDRGKPDPAAFLEAARRLRADPSTCVVVENAPLGAVAAKSAGMQCYVALNNTPLQSTDFGDSVSTGKIFGTTRSVLQHLVEAVAQ